MLKITLLFEYYGRFVDMGVGKGVKIGDVKESITTRKLSGKMLGNRRRPKKWYSKTFHAEIDNDWADDMGDPSYFLDLLLRIINPCGRTSCIHLVLPLFFRSNPDVHWPVIS